MEKGDQFVHDNRNRWKQSGQLAFRMRQGNRPALVKIAKSAG
jgi:hypothetical protein